MTGSGAELPSLWDAVRRARGVRPVARVQRAGQVSEFPAGILKLSGCRRMQIQKRKLPGMQIIKGDYLYSGQLSFLGLRPARNYKKKGTSPPPPFVGIAGWSCPFLSFVI